MVTRVRSGPSSLKVTVVNIVSGAINLQARGHLSYDAAKGALFYVTRSMAASLGPRIRVNGIMPGIIETEAMKAVVAKREGVLEQLIAQTRMRRLGWPRDIGLAAVYLASPAASWVTAVLLDIEAGRAQTIDTKGRPSATWGQPWLSAYLGMRRGVARGFQASAGRSAESLAPQRK